MSWATEKTPRVQKMTGNGGDLVDQAEDHFGKGQDQEFDNLTIIPRTGNQNIF